MLDQLQQAAYDRSERGRATLLDLLTSCVFVARRPTPGEARIYGEIAEALIGRVDAEARRRVAETVAEESTVPASLIRRLAVDIVPVAAPVLSRSPVLGEADLVSLAETLSCAHLAAIAVRTALTVPVTDVLVRRGDLPVFMAVAANTSAGLGLRSAHRLVDEAEVNDDLCRVLVVRTDLPTDESDRLVALVARRLMALRPSSAQPVAAPAEAAPPEERKPAPRQTPLHVLIERVRKGAETLDAVVGQLADDDRTNDLAALLSQLADLENMSLLQMLVRADAAGIMGVMRGLDIAPDTWRKVVTMRRRRLKLSDTQARYERDDFAKVDPIAARASLTHLRLRRAAR